MRFAIATVLPLLGTLVEAVPFEGSITTIVGSWE